MRKSHLIITAALLAFILKLLIAFNTIGTSDVVLFQQWGRLIEKDGLSHTYENVKLFNHTPLVGNFSAVLVSLSGHNLENLDTNNMQLLLGSIQASYFPLILRLPGIIADFLSVLLVLHITGRYFKGCPTWAVVLFALSPISLMVSGYHGNLDPLLPLLLLCAVWACLESKAGLCGLALAFACQIKVAPLLLAPAFFFFWWERKEWIRFSLTASIVTLIGWSPALIGAPMAFLNNALGYSGYWGIWGISYWLKASGIAGFTQFGTFKLAAAQKVVIAITKYLVIGTSLILSWRNRTRDAATLCRTISIIACAFFVLSPGIAVQYFVWFAPFILLATPRWYVAITAAGSVFLFVFYNTISNGAPWTIKPWLVGISTNQHLPLWGPWHVLPWIVFIAYGVWWLSKAIRHKPTTPEQETPASIS